MRKFMVSIVALGVAAGALAAPASAAKAKKPIKVSEDIAATAAPLPNLSSHSGTARPGCAAGQEGVHWVGTDFTAPGKGKLVFTLEGFQGDWDLYVFGEGDVPLARSEATQVNTNDPAAPAPPEEKVELAMTKGQTVKLVVCNWAGEPSVTAHYAGTFR